jgi:hypothetical protein
MGACRLVFVLFFLTLACAAWLGSASASCVLRPAASSHQWHQGRAGVEVNLVSGMHPMATQPEMFAVPCAPALDKRNNQCIAVEFALSACDDAVSWMLIDPSHAWSSSLIATALLEMKA